VDLRLRQALPRKMQAHIFRSLSALHVKCRRYSEALREIASSVPPAALPPRIETRLIFGLFIGSTVELRSRRASDEPCWRAGGMA
jgi:hypothetical protein